MTDNLQGRNDEIINNIKSLQTTEMKLYDSLESKSLNSDQKQQIIEKINQISSCEEKPEKIDSRDPWSLGLDRPFTILTNAAGNFSN